MTPIENLLAMFDAVADTHDDPLQPRILVGDLCRRHGRPAVRL